MKKIFSFVLLIIMVFNCFLGTTVSAASSLDEDYCQKSSDGIHDICGFVAGSSKVDDCTQPRYYTTICRACNKEVWTQVDSNNTLESTYHNMLPGGMVSSDCELGVFEHSYCKHCKFELNENIGVMEHSWSKKYISDNCSTGVILHSKCTVCNKETCENLGAQEHSFSVVEAEDNIYPTCTQEGKLHYKCDVCEYEVFQTVPAGHTYSDWVIDNAATCTKAGKRHKTCTKCTFTINETISATGHNFYSEDITMVEMRCTNCGIVPNECTHPYTENYYSPPTCNLEGYDCIRCRDCKIIFQKTKTYIILGHDFTANNCSRCGTKEFEYSSIDNNSVVITGYNGDKTEVKIPAVIAGCQVAGISWFAFENNKNITFVSIPGSVKTISLQAFVNCSNLKSVVFSEGLQCIGEAAFRDCTQLTFISLPESVNYVDGAAFWNCDKLKYVFYSGSKSDWLNITIGNSNESLTKAIIHYNSTGHSPSNWITDHTTRTKYKECTVCKKVLESQKIPLAAPTINSCYNEVDGVQLGWTAVGEATSYRVYRKLPTDKNWTLLTTTTALTYRDKKVTGNTAYQYSVKALDKNNNESDFSALKENRYIEFPKLTSRASAFGGVQISWQKVAGATSYRIYRRGAASNNWSYLGEVPATQSSFFDKEGTDKSQIKSGNYYRYTVRASYSGKDSFGNDHLRYSGFDTNGLYLKYVATPKLTSISNAGAGKTEGIKITWNKVNGGGTTWYRVYRRGAGSSNWRYLGATQGNSWTDKETKNYSGNYYRYTVRAVAGTQDTGWYSAFDTNGLYIKRIANPTLKSATSAKAGITVKWSPVKGTTGYYVYRKTANSGWQCVGTVKGTNNVSFLDKTAKKGTTYTYTVRACYGTTKSYFNSGIKCYDKY